MGLGACRRERKGLGEMGESELDNSRIGRAGQVRDGLQMLDSLGRETEGTGEFGHDNHRRAYREKQYIRDTRDGENRGCGKTYCYCSTEQAQSVSRIAIRKQYKSACSYVTINKPRGGRSSAAASSRPGAPTTPPNPACTRPACGRKGAGEKGESEQGRAGDRAKTACG
jgi:hypothetical protein